MSTSPHKDIIYRNLIYDEQTKNTDQIKMGFDLLVIKNMIRRGENSINKRQSSETIA